MCDINHAPCKHYSTICISRTTHLYLNIVTLCMLYIKLYSYILLYTGYILYIFSKSFQVSWIFKTVISYMFSSIYSLHSFRYIDT